MKTAILAIPALLALMACKQPAPEKPAAPVRKTDITAALNKAMRADACGPKAKECMLDSTLARVNRAELSQGSEAELAIDTSADTRVEAFRVCYWAHRQYPAAKVHVQFREKYGTATQHSYATLNHGGC